METLGIGEDVLAIAPTEQDTLHTKKTFENAPHVSFRNPSDGGNVTSPRMTISLNVNAPNGFQAVQFFVDDRLLKSFDTLEDEYVIPIAKIWKNTTSSGSARQTLFIREVLKLPFFQKKIRLLQKFRSPFHKRMMCSLGNDHPFSLLRQMMPLVLFKS